MVKQFYEDLVAAKEAERLVEMYFRLLADQTYDFRNVSEDPDYYYKGDLLALDSTGREIGIEIKDDSRIAETGNILCEESVYYIDSGYEGKGNMSCDYDIYCIVSKTEKKIYILDFKKLRKIYKVFGIAKEIPHSDQITYCFLVPLWVAKKQGCFVAEIDYNSGSPEAKTYNAFEEEAKVIEKRLKDQEKWRKMKECGLLNMLS